ncbi:MAG: hypothetical protein JW838_00075 [Spirochaetes bacterium]|nr:hypothetical protein [Spirochaetota bacterium]
MSEETMKLIQILRNPGDYPLEIVADSMAAIRKITMRVSESRILHVDPVE